MQHVMRRNIHRRRESVEYFILFKLSCVVLRNLKKSFAPLLCPVTRVAVLFIDFYNFCLCDFEQAIIFFSNLKYTMVKKSLFIVSSVQNFFKLKHHIRCALLNIGTSEKIKTTLFQAHEHNSYTKFSVRIYHQITQRYS